MMTFTIRLRAEEPLVITSGSAESMAHEMLGYIPGNMLLGAFAESWKRVHHGVEPDASPVFQRLFLDGGVSWGMAFPLCGEESGVPVPRSYMRVKNHKGLPGVGEDADGHVVVNLLRVSDDDNLTAVLRERGVLAQDEAAKLKKFGSHFMGRKSLRIAEEKREWNIHVALGTQRSALEGQLFGYSSMAAGTEFACTVTCCDEETGRHLRNLLSLTKSFRVGRSRSAGYGRVSVLEVTEEVQNNEAVSIAAGQEFAIFCLSHYMSSVSWLSPVESLCEELERLCGEPPVLTRKFCTYVEIQGYNAMWKKPRASRTAMEQGSVFLCSFKKAVRLPGKLMLGGSRIEGYGRMEVDPEFLDKSFPDIPTTDFNVPEKKGLRPQSSPLWRIMRRRALDRRCEERTYAMLLEDCWQQFLSTAARNAHPSASQRGNIRRIVTELPHDCWESAFGSMLENSRSAGEQWRESVAFSPFSRGNDYMDVIMKELLSMKRGEEFLPEGQEEGVERYAAREKAHRLFLLRLLSVWNRKSLAGTDGRN